jgi:hypothetical protein
LKSVLRLAIRLVMFAFMTKQMVLRSVVMYYFTEALAELICPAEIFIH